MRRQWLLNLLILLILLSALACGPQGGGETPEPTQPARASQGKCGDGVCDGPENAQTCPQDCAPTAPVPTDTPVLPTTAPRGRCGDGVCDEAEKADPALCPQDCPPATPPTQEPPTPAPVRDTPIPKVEVTKAPGKCGDGICDELEQKDPNLCPQDCPTAPAATPGAAPVPTGAGAPDYEPPINVFVVLHIDPLGALGAEVFRPEPGMYIRTHDEIDWLTAEAARHDLRFTSLYNGWYTKWALEHDDLDQFQALLAAGHEVGSHTHQITYDAHTDAWISHHDKLSVYGRPNYDPGLARQAWDDASRYLEAVLEAIGVSGQNEIMCSTALSLPDERNLMAEFGFTIAAGNRLEAGAQYIGHMPWNPWRAANSDEPGYEVAEDLKAPYMSINHGAQIGGSEGHDVDVAVPHLQRQFLMLYTEWLARERTGAEDRVWSFGFVYHPNQGDRYNADLAEFLDWLDAHFIGKRSPHGHTIARYAMVSEIVLSLRAR
jgi:hypothetical protein